MHCLRVPVREIVLAKAMFLAYADPFEKYRALLFEYAHTLGHGVEAYCNLAYQMAKACVPWSSLTRTLTITLLEGPSCGGP